MSESEQNKNTPAPAKVRVRYEQTNASYASQFVIHANQEEVIINFSAGYLRDPGSDETTLPIHNRIAMSPGGAARLIKTLTQALQNVEQTSTSRGQAEAGLPKLN